MPQFNLVLHVKLSIVHCPQKYLKGLKRQDTVEITDRDHLSWGSIAEGQCELHENAIMMCPEGSTLANASLEFLIKKKLKFNHQTQL